MHQSVIFKEGCLNVNRRLEATQSQEGNTRPKGLSLNDLKFITLSVNPAFHLLFHLLIVTTATQCLLSVIWLSIRPCFPQLWSATQLRNAVRPLFTCKTTASDSCLSEAHIFCKECAMQLMKADVPCPFYCTGAHFGGLSPLLLVVFGFVKKLDYEVAAVRYVPSHYFSYPCIWFEHRVHQQKEQLDATVARSLSDLSKLESEVKAVSSCIQNQGISLTS